MTAFVDDAAEYARLYGGEEEVAAFNDLDDPFVDGELYIFAYAMDGTTPALPFQPEEIDPVSGICSTFQPSYGR